LSAGECRLITNDRYCSRLFTFKSNINTFLDDDLSRHLCVFKKIYIRDEEEENLDMYRTS